MAQINPNDAYIVAAEEPQGWRGFLMVNNRTPSGCDRWQIRVSTTLYYPTRREAEMILSGKFDAVPVFDPVTQTYSWQEAASL